MELNRRPKCHFYLNFYLKATGNESAHFDGQVLAIFPLKLLLKFCRQNLRTFSTDFWRLKSRIRRLFSLLECMVSYWSLTNTKITFSLLKQTNECRHLLFGFICHLVICPWGQFNGVFNKSLEERSLLLATPYFPNNVFDLALASRTLITFIFTSGNKISFYLICLPIYFHCSLNKSMFIVSWCNWLLY